MTLLSVVRDVCAVVGVPSPQSVFSNITGNRTMQEMLSLANEMAQRIAYDNRDWTRLKKTVSYPGNGVATAFNLPVDYKRMLLTGNVWRSTSAITPMQFIPDTDEWLTRRAQNLIASSFGEWTMMGGQILFSPVLSASESATFAYLHKNCIALNSGGLGDTFQNDLDGFPLDERLLKLGMTWQWKANKGSPYNEDMGSYGDALAIVQGHDIPSPIILGNRPMSQSVRIAYPLRLPT